MDETDDFGIYADEPADDLGGEDPWAARLRETFIYDPATGHFTWKDRPREHFKTEGAWKRFKAMHAGRPAFQHVTCCGYHAARVFGRLIRAHQAAFAITTGRWSQRQIDHINRDGLDNRISNLRECTQQENNRNVLRRCKSGFKGVSLCRHSWQARITLNGVKIHLGTYATAEAAALAFDRVARIEHGEFARLNFPKNGELAA